MATSNAELARVARLWERKGVGTLVNELADALEAAEAERDAAHRRGYEDAICWVYASADTEPEVLAEFMEFYEPPTKATS